MLLICCIFALFLFCSVCLFLLFVVVVVLFRFFVFVCCCGFFVWGGSGRFVLLVYIYGSSLYRTCGLLFSGLRFSIIMIVHIRSK